MLHSINSDTKRSIPKDLPTPTHEFKPMNPPVSPKKGQISVSESRPLRQMPEPENINTHMVLDIPEPIVYDLIVILGVIPRFLNGKQIDYLEKAVNSLHAEVSKYPTRNILVYVQNNDPMVESIGFAKVMADPKFSKMHFIFRTVAPRLDDPHTDDPNHDYMDPNNVLPGHKARQQICDVASIIDFVTTHYSFEYALFMEDDFIVCPGIFEKLFNVIDLLKKKDKNMCGVRISYGMSGILLNRSDLKEFREFAFKKMLIMPIDNALQWFWLGKDSFCQERKVYTYQTVLMEHFGDVSTFPERNSESFKRFRRRFPSCGEFINNAWNLNAKELFRSECLGHPSNLSPCK
jgi:hypothetical protein